MKLILRIVSVVVVLVLAALAGVLVFFDPLVKSGIEKGATYATGTETKLGSVDASLFSGRFGLKDLSISNPPGFRPEPFLRLGSAQATWDNGTILSDEIAMGTFALDGVALSLESAGGKTNYGAILSNLKKIAGSGAETTEPSAAKSKTLTIKRIEIKNINAGVHLTGSPLASGSLSVEVPLVAIDNFRSDGSTSEIVAKLTRTLVEAILQGTLQAGKGSLPIELSKDLAGSLQGLETSFQDQARDILKGIEPKLHDAQDALKGAGELFKPKKK